MTTDDTLELNPVTPRTLRPVDLVAVILAAALSLALILLCVIGLVQVIEERTPTATLGTPAAQLLSAAITGIASILGGYIGFNLGCRR